MNNVALFIQLNTLPNTRETVWELWKKFLIPNLSENDNVQFLAPCFDENCETRIYVFELFTCREEIEKVMNSSWMKQFQAEVRELLESPPEVTITKPCWIKGVE